jgi:hypothetical protein
MIDDINESGMLFFDNNDVFRIEKSKCYSDTLKRKGLKSVELIRLKKETFYFIEAKTTPPLDKNSESFKHHISRIMLKFIHSVYLFGAVKMNVKEGAELPDCFIVDSEKPRKISFMLIYGNSSISNEHLNDIQSVMKNYIDRYAPKLSLLLCPKIIVMNRGMAERNGFIKSEE